MHIWIVGWKLEYLKKIKALKTYVLLGYDQVTDLAIEEYPIFFHYPSVVALHTSEFIL